MRTARKLLTAAGAVLLLLPALTAADRWDVRREIASADSRWEVRHEVREAHREISHERRERRREVRREVNEAYWDW